MDKNLFLAMILSMAVILGYYAVFPPPQGPPPATNDTSAGAPATPQPIESLEPRPAEPLPIEPLPIEPRSAEPRPAEPLPDTAGLQQDSRDNPTTTEPKATTPAATRATAEVRVELPPYRIDTPEYVLLLEPRGGVIRAMTLKHYRRGKIQYGWGDWIPPLGSAISFLSANNPPDAELPVSMLGRQLPGRSPLALRLAENPAAEAIEAALAQTVFTTATESLTLRRGEQGTLTLRGVLDDELVFLKTLTVDGDSYVIEYDLRVINYADTAYQLGFIPQFAQAPRFRTREQAATSAPSFACPTTWTPSTPTTSAPSPRSPTSSGWASPPTTSSPPCTRKRPTSKEATRHNATPTIAGAPPCKSPCPA